MLAALAAYLQFSDLDLSQVYVLFAAIAGVFVVLAIVRVLARVRENRQVQQSSWRTFAKVAKVRGLNAAESRALTEVVRQCRVKRPSQVLGSLPLFDKCLDRVLERASITEEQQVLLESARTKLAAKTQRWDGHQNRRQFARLGCSFGLRAYAITKEHLDEEVKSTYQETDPEFRRALDSVISAMVPADVQVVDLSAGGMSLVMGESEPIREGDYVSLAGAEDMPLNLEGIVGRVLSQEHLEDQHQEILHLGFLPLEAEVKRAIIQHVHTSLEASGDPGTGGRRRPGPPGGPKPPPPAPKRRPKAPGETGQRPVQSGG